MGNLFIKQIKEKISQYTDLNAHVVRNIVKEELQYYVLDCVYHHPVYKNWIMYGGSALRICHRLNRMSVDLDFEIHEIITKKLLNEIKKALSNYFKEYFEVDEHILQIQVKSRGLKLKFYLAEQLGISLDSNFIHVNLDLHHFVASHVVIDAIPIDQNQLSFVIKTYNMSALMASKIAAILLRTKRNVGKFVFNEMGRDIYDLLWYMERRIVPDIDYLNAKGLEIKDLPELFNALNKKITEVSDDNLKMDLFPLFTNSRFIENWLQNWRENYQYLCKTHYTVYAITRLKSCVIEDDIKTDNHFFTFTYETSEGENVRIMYVMTYEAVHYLRGSQVLEINESLLPLLSFRAKQTLHLQKLASLFYQKNIEYFEKTGNNLIGREIRTKILCVNMRPLNPNEHLIILNYPDLKSRELEDLLK